MPLEVATYISELAPANPPGTDLRKQGDDHLRLIKAALQATFPGASKPFYFPSHAAKTANYTVLSSEANKTFSVATNAGTVTITLPILVAGDAGWSASIQKTDVSANALLIVPGAGTINGEASLRLSNIYDAAFVFWTGTAWLAVVDKLAVRVRSITADTVLVEADLDSLILCTPAANTTITLPAVANYVGRSLAVTHIPNAAFTTTLDGNGAETINGAATVVLPITRNSVLLIATTTGWELVGSSSNTASTTETLTGTDTAKSVTPDGLAAFWEKGSDIASAATITIGEGGLHHVTGTTGISDIDFTTAKDGRPAVLIFDGILILTHSSTLPLQGSANITTAAGDLMFVWQDNGDTVKTVFVRASGVPVVSAETWVLDQNLASGSSGNATSAVLGATYKEIKVMFDQISHDSGSNQSIRIALSDDGSTYGSAVSVTNSENAAFEFGLIVQIKMTDQVSTKFIFSSEGKAGTEAVETSPTTRLRFTPSGGNFDGGGTFRIYGRTQ